MKERTDHGINLYSDDLDVRVGFNLLEEEAGHEHRMNNA